MKKTPFLFSLIIGAILLLTLVILSLQYWQERVIMADAAFQVFSVVLREDWAIQVQRFGATLVQLFPVLAMKADWSLSGVLQAYSAAFTIYPLLLFGLLVWPIKNYKMALVLVFFYGLMQMHTFFWIQSELLIGCALGLFLLGFIDRWPRPKWWLAILQAFLLVTVVYCHPLALFPFGVGLVFLGFKTENRSSKWFIGLFVLTALIVVYKHWIAPIGGYDANAVGLLDGFEDRLPNFFQLASTKFFWERLWSSYYLVPAAYLGISIYYFKERKLLKWTWLTGALLAWLILILTTYHWGAQQFYIESYYLVLSAILGVVLAYDIWPVLPTRWLAPAILVVVSVIRIGQIADASKKYTDRLNWNKEQLELMKTLPETQFIISRAHTPHYLLQLDWAVGYETLLLSALDGPEATQTLIIAEKPADIEKYKAMSGAFATPFGPISLPSLNKSPYFQLNDSPAKLLK